MRRNFVSVCACLLLGLNGAAGAVVELGSSFELESAALERAMNIVVHLPDGYEGGDARYPVLYMVGSEWRSHFALAAATLDMMRDLGQVPAAILVGVDLPEGNGVLVPRGTPPDTSATDAHLAFLVDELLPDVERRYRTAPYRMLYGASNSGLFGVYALLSRPEAFDAILASSPMLGWCYDLLEERARKTLAAAKMPPRTLALVYSDDDYERVIGFVPRLGRTIESLRPAWLSVVTEVRHNEGHVPTVDLALALKAVFPDFNPPNELESVAAIAAHFDSLTRRYHFHIEAPADMVFDLGMRHVVAGRLEQAQQVFEQAVAAFPAMSRAYVGLGVVHERKGDTERALELFRKAIEVDPDDRLAARQVERLTVPK